MLWLPLLAPLLGSTSALHALLVSTVSSPSHYIFLNALAGGLLQRGHRVTELVIKPPAEPHPNRTSFVIAEPVYADAQGIDLEESHDSDNLIQEISFLFEFCRFGAETALQSKAMVALLAHVREKKPQFDVMVIDYVLQEPLLGLNSVVGRVPVVAMTAYNLPEDVLELMGSPYLPSLLPYQGVGAHGGVPMTFAERAYNVYKWLAYKAYIRWAYLPDVEKMIAKAFPGSPPLSELQRDVALALVNTSPALHGAMPLVPGIVEVGGMQARPAKPLPRDLQDWLDGAEHGFVFMSFGTNVKSANMIPQKRDAVLRAFNRLKQRVLWKYEADDIQDRLPANVRVAKWLPQNDILAHPKISCFVSHNGGLSSQEAAYHGVPVVGVPFYADQIGYAEKFGKLGLGRRVRYSTLNEESFFEALDDVVNNPRYRENMGRVRQTLRDQKETPLERAVWFVEYAARTRGAPHLRSPALGLRWFQVWLLDVLAAAALALGLALWLVFKALRAVCGGRTSSSRQRKAKTQ